MLRALAHCEYCGVWLPYPNLPSPNDAWEQWRKTWVIDHISPRCVAGDNSGDNIALSCIQCNQSKGIRHATMPERPALASFYECGRVLGDHMYSWSRARRNARRWKNATST